MLKVEIIKCGRKKQFEKELNNFISKNKVKDIQFQYAASGPNLIAEIYTALIQYEE